MIRIVYMYVYLDSEYDKVFINAGFNALGSKTKIYFKLKF